MKKMSVWVFFLCFSLAYCSDPNIQSESLKKQDWVKDLNEQKALGGIWNGRFIQSVINDVDEMLVKVRVTNIEIKKMSRLEPDLVPMIEFFREKYTVKIFQHTASKDKILLKMSGDIVALETSPDDSIHLLADDELIVLSGLMRVGNYQYQTTQGAINTVALYKRVPKEIMQNLYYRFVYKCGLETDYVQGLIEHNICQRCNGTGKVNLLKDGNIVGKTTCEEIFKNPIYKDSSRKIYVKRWEKWPNH